jgi:hypothetical protein
MAENYELKIDQGASLELSFLFADENNVPINLTGYTARMQLRTSYTAPTHALELTTENNRILLTPLEGKMTLSLPASVTTTIIPQRYVYDVELVSPTGFVTRAIEGDAIVTPEVTRNDP